jgi:azurin
MSMRMMIALPLLAAAACNVENDTGNDQVTLEYNQQRVEDAAEKTARTARDIGSSIANVADSTGQAISNEVGDIDVDVNVDRDRNREPETNNQ